MNNEYAVAYELTESSDLALFQNDFLVFLRGLSVPEKYQLGLADIPEDLLSLLAASDCKNTDKLPERWQDELKELLELIDVQGVSCKEIDDLFGLRKGSQAYEASFQQALFFLFSYKNIYKDIPEDIIVLTPKKFVPFPV